MKFKNFSIVTMLFLTSLSFTSCGSSDSEYIGLNEPEQNKSMEEQDVTDDKNLLINDLEPLPQFPESSKDTPPNPTITETQE